MDESSWRWAGRKTVADQKTIRFLWSGEAVFAVAGGTWLSALAPTGASVLEVVVRSVIGGLLGLITAVGLIFIFNLAVAPYRQRDDARETIRELLAEEKWCRVELEDEQSAYRKTTESDASNKTWVIRQTYVIIRLGIHNLREKTIDEVQAVLIPRGTANEQHLLVFHPSGRKYASTDSFSLNPGTTDYIDIVEWRVFEERPVGGANGRLEQTLSLMVNNWTTLPGPLPAIVKVRIEGINVVPMYANLVIWVDSQSDKFDPKRIRCKLVD